MESKNLWVVVETEEGVAKNVGYELLSVGRTLADKLGEQLVALVMGKNVQAVAPVSYTHLDVYKRQVFSLLSIITFDNDFCKYFF